MTSFEYQFQLDAGETVRASQQIQRRRRLGWLPRVIGFVPLGVTGLALAVGVPWRALQFLGSLGVLLAVMTVIAPVLQRRRLQGIYAESPSFREPQRYQFSEEGFSVTGGPMATTLRWDGVIEARETEEFFLLFVSRRSAYYLPKRVVPNAVELGALRRLLLARLGDRAQVIRPGGPDPLAT